MRATIVYKKSDKSIVATYGECWQPMKDFLSANNYDDTHDVVYFNHDDDYSVEDYEIDADGIPILSVTADSNQKQRIKDAFSSDAEFKAVRLAFKNILAQAKAGTLNTYTMADLADDIANSW